MTNEFPVLLVTQKAYEASFSETLGSKYKFWFDHEELGSCLYKQSRANLGEDWAEKVAAELCELLGLPHAVYKLASTWEGNRGVVSPNFLSKSGTLVHGNELLSSIVPNYPAFSTYGVSQHTIDVVLSTITRQSVNLPIDWIPPSGIQTAVDVFVGYLLLDAWIGNGECAKAHATRSPPRKLGYCPNQSSIDLTRNGTPSTYLRPCFKFGTRPF